MYKNILFDFDGTIFDTSKGIINALKYSLGKFKLDYSKLELSKFIGPPLDVSLNEFFGLNENEALDVIKAFREYYWDIGLYESEIYDEISDVLKTLKNNERDIFVASTKPTVCIEKLLDKNGLSKYFTYISGSPMEGSGTPKDKIISTIMEKYELNPEETIMIGDRKYDIIGAKNNNIATIGVEYGFGTFDELKEYKCEYIAKEPSDILSIVI